MTAVLRPGAQTVMDHMAALGMHYVGPRHPNGRQANPKPEHLKPDSLEVVTYHTVARDIATAHIQLDHVFASHGLHEAVTTRAMNEIDEWGVQRTTAGSSSTWNDARELSTLTRKLRNSTADTMESSPNDGDAGRHRPTGRPVLVGNPPGSTTVAKTSGLKPRHSWYSVEGQQDPTQTGATSVT